MLVPLRRLAILIVAVASLATVLLAGCRPILGLNETPGLATDADDGGQGPASEDAGPVQAAGPRPPVGAAPDGEAPLTDGGAVAVMDGGVRAVDLAYPAWPLPVESPPATNYSVDRGTVFDHVTGLRWQAEVPAKMLYSAAQDYCATLSLADYTDWRLPSRIELLTLLDFGADGAPTIQRAAFPSTVLDAFWSQSDFSGNPDTETWVADFRDATLYWLAKEVDPHSVRCVRGTVQADPLPPHWGRNAEEALDLGSGLVWQRAPAPSRMNLTDALLYCQSLTVDGHGGYRLPNARELHSIASERATQYGLDLRVFEHGSTLRYWTTSRALGSALGEQRVVDVGFGGSSFHVPAGETAGVRCVRGPTPLGS